MSVQSRTRADRTHVYTHTRAYTYIRRDTTGTPRRGCQSARGIPQSLIPASSSSSPPSSSATLRLPRRGLLLGGLEREKRKRLQLARSLIHSFVSPVSPSRGRRRGKFLRRRCFDATLLLPPPYSPRRPRDGRGWSHTLSLCVDATPRGRSFRFARSWRTSRPVTDRIARRVIHVGIQAFSG